MGNCSRMFLSESNLFKNQHLIFWEKNDMMLTIDRGAGKTQVAGADRH